MQKINFASGKVRKVVSTSPDTLGGDINLETNLKLLRKIFPTKINFSVDEAADALNISYDFVAEKIRKGNIKARKLGRRPMIHINELARLLTYGIK